MGKKKDQGKGGKADEYLFMSDVTPKIFKCAVLIFSATLEKGYYSSHFADEKTEV